MHLDLSLSQGRPRAAAPAPTPTSPPVVGPAGTIPARPATARGLVDAGLPVPDTADPAGSADTALRSWTVTVVTASDPCLVLNRSGLVTACSAAATELLGLPEPATMVGRGLLDGGLQPIDFTAAGDRLSDWELHRLPPLAALATGSLSRGLLRLRQGRRIRTVDAIATPLHHDTDLVGSLTFFRPL